jgi:hypothetical protein
VILSEDLLRRVPRMYFLLRVMEERFKTTVVRGIKQGSGSNLSSRRGSLERIVTLFPMA